METVDREVLSVLIYQQWMEATDHAHWDEAAMALYKLQAIADGEPFTDLVIHKTETEAPCGEQEAA